MSQDVPGRMYAVAMKTPSVCNRQVTRAYRITDSDKQGRSGHLG